ncbi:ParA family protein [Pseudomonas viridiflava]|uniref:ParA family protein n=1 Tax=Pseudomonas viridiflava TaxID=33069 RepID=UPI000F044E92|nr:ParA family protein [Pseudomonas viridiflava]
MPTVAAASPKGGAGKTTTMINLALQIVKQGAEVALIDADPNGPLKKFAAGGNCPPGLHIITDVNENNIVPFIRDAATKYPFVLVDLEGTAAKIVVYALQYADYVIIPMRGSFLDAEEAGKAIQLVKDQEMAAQRHNPNYSLPYSVLFTCTPAAYETRNTSGLRKDLEDLGIPMFDVEMKERDAFKSMFKYKQPLEQLDTSLVPGVATAIINAEALAAEVIAKLEAVMEAQQ